MTPVYIVVLVLVTCFLISIPLFPFWKFWARLKGHHPDLWASAGPFNFRDMLAHGEIMGNFLDLADKIAADESFRQRDPLLARWAHMSSSLYAMAPRSFMGQLGCVLVLFYFIGFLTAVIVRVFSHA